MVWSHYFRHLLFRFIRHLVIYYSVLKRQPNTNLNTIWVWKVMLIRIQIYSVLKNHPSTNTNSTWFENICRIRIPISLFGLNYSNTIRIPNYSLTSGLPSRWQIFVLLLLNRSEEILPHGSYQKCIKHIDLIVVVEEQ